MPSLPTAPNCLRIRWLGTYAGKNWANVFHAQFTAGVPVPADLNTLAASLAGIWNTRISPSVNTGVALTGTDVQDLSSNTGAFGSSNIGHAGAYSTGGALPANVAVAISFKTSYHYRGGHPRMYLPGMSGGLLQTPTTWTSAFTSLLQAAGNGIIADIGALTSSSTGSLQMVMVSYYHNKVLRPQGVPYLISSAVVHPRVDSMRRRLGKEVP